MAFAFGASICESFRYRLEEQFDEAEVGSIVETELPEARSDPVSNEVQRSLTDDPWIERGGGFRAIAVDPDHRKTFILMILRLVRP